MPVSHFEQFNCIVSSIRDLSDRLRSPTESELVQSKLYYSLELRAVFIQVVETPRHDCMQLSGRRVSQQKFNIFVM